MAARPEAPPFRAGSSHELNGIRVDVLEDFVRAVQQGGSRSCGLEGLKPSLEGDPVNGAEGQQAAASAAVEALDASLKAFIASYPAFDHHFECIKKASNLFVPMEFCREALELDRAAWHLSQAAMVAGEAARAARRTLQGSPLRHPFLVDRTQRYVETVFLGRHDADEKPPEPPFAQHDPRNLGGPEKEVLATWIARYAHSADAWRRAQESSRINKGERATMVRWLEGIGRFEALSIAAQQHGASISATGAPLTDAQRADLRHLKTEMSAFHAVRLDVAQQVETLSKVQGTGAEADIERERKVLERLGEMRDHHKARATFHWVSSFHFDKGAQAEAEAIAPRLIAAVRADIEPGVAEQSGQVGMFLAEQPEPVREAIREMAQASQSRTKAKKASTSGRRILSTTAARKLAERIAAAARAIGDKTLARMETALPMLTKQAARMISLTEPTPIERLVRRVGDWRLEGLAAADRRMRMAPDQASRTSAYHTMTGYARAIIEDLALMSELRKIDPACVVWIEKTAGITSKGGARISPPARPPTPGAPPAPGAPSGATGQRPPRQDDAIPEAGLVSQAPGGMMG